MGGVFLYTLVGGIEVAFVLVAVWAPLRLRLLMQCLFFAFTLAGSILLVLNGVASCGCFGSLSVSPVTSAGISLASLAFLGILRFFVIREKVEIQLPHVAFTSERLGILAAVCCLIGIVFVQRLWRDGGDQIYAEPVVVSGISVGDSQVLNVRVFNSSSASAEILGVEKSCTCLVTDKVRDILPPGSHKDLIIHYRPNRAGDTRQSVRYFLSHPQQNWLTVDISSSVSGED